MPIAHLLAAVLLAVDLASVGHAGSIEIRHDPVACVPLDRYTRLAATAASASQVVQAEIQFRVDAAGGWYSLRMAPHDGEWSGQLSRPVTPLERFEYRIVMTASDLTTVETPTVRARVAAVRMQCEDAPHFSASVDAPIVVRVPAGAPAVPPVPSGFSPAGVMAASDPVHRSRAVKIGTGATLAAGIAAGVAIAGSASAHAPSVPGPPPPLLPPQFSITAFTPPGGSVISLTSGRVVFTVRVTGALGVPLDFAWRLEFRLTTSVCVVMVGAASVGPGRPEDAVLTAPLMSTGACGPRFELDALVLTIRIGDEIVDQEFMTRRFHFEP